MVITTGRYITTYRVAGHNLATIQSNPTTVSKIPHLQYDCIIRDSSYFIVASWYKQIVLCALSLLPHLMSYFIIAASMEVG